VVHPSTSSLGVLAVCLVAGAVGCTPARRADATVLRAVDFDTQSVSANRIFVGEVIAVESRRKPDAPRYFETIVTFRVDEPVAGTMPPTLPLRFSGGQVGDLRQSIDGMPEFAVGERYVVFLEPDQDPPLVSPIVGFNQGLYRVVAESAGGGVERTVVRDYSGRSLTAGSAARAAAARSADGTEPSLDAFLTAIRAARR
jgi:hypothetical protein